MSDGDRSETTPNGPQEAGAHGGAPIICSEHQPANGPVARRPQSAAARAVLGRLSSASPLSVVLALLLAAAARGATPARGIDLARPGVLNLRQPAAGAAGRAE